MKPRIKTGVLIASSSNKIIRINSKIYIYKEGIIQPKIIKIITR
jgi:hypothetical protein